MSLIEGQTLAGYINSKFDFLFSGNIDSFPFSNIQTAATALSLCIYSHETKSCYLAQELSMKLQQVADTTGIGNFIPVALQHNYNRVTLIQCTQSDIVSYLVTILY